MDPSRTPVLKTSIGDLWVEPGIVCLRVDRPRVSVDMMRDQLAFIKKLEASHPIVPAPVLVDLGLLQEIERQAREYAAALLNPRWNLGVALLYHNDVQRVIASFFRGFKTLEVPLVMSGSRDEAVAMLLRAAEGGVPEPAAAGPADRVQVIVDAVASMASGNFDIDIDFSEDQDEVAALACCIRMLAEETDNLIRLRRRAEAELLALNTKLTEEVSARERMGLELETINAELEGFAHTVSHDLRGPLSAIGASARLVIHMRELPRSPELESNMDELLWLIVNNVEKSDKFIEDTLMLAEAGQVPQVVCGVEISSIVSHVLQERSRQVEEKRIAVEVDEDLGSVIANPTHMYQLFSNLISNAIEHNRNPAPRLAVSRLHSEGDACRRYLVRDNGDGIPPDEMEHLFKPFFKGAPGTSGIGLSIVDRIVKVYDGEVRVVNDGGACFEVSLYDYR